MKKITLLFICLVSVLNISAEVYSGSCGDNASYTLDTETGLLSITGTGAMTDYYGQAPWIAQRSYIKSAGIADGITSIGYAAFSGCSDMTSIEIPNSVTSIGINAFYGCSGLTSVAIPNSVIEIGRFALDGCYFEKQNFINNSRLDAETNNYWGAIIVDSRENGFVINDGVLLKYYGHESSVTIPNSVTSIGSRAFYGCSDLTSVEIPNSVTQIGDYAFLSCSGLTSVTIPNSVASLVSSAFSGCTGLTSIIVESGNEKYDSRNNCNAIIETPSNTLIRGCINTEIPNSVTSIGDMAFSACSGLTSVIIPNSVTSIGFGAFSGCFGLTSLTIPNSVTSIGGYAFNNCSGLTSITITESVTTIGEYAFYECSGLTSVHITDLEAWCKIDFPDFTSNPLSYAHHLFMDGKEITDLVIPNSVTSIGERAFSSCSSLTSVTIPNSITSIGYWAFQGCSGLTSVHITNLGAWCKIKFADGFSNPLSIAHHLFIDGNEIKDLVIHDSVQSISDYAFRNCLSLTSVTIPNSVSSIGNYVFQGCFFEKQGFINNSSLDAETNNYWGARIVDSRDNGFVVKDGVLLIYIGNESSVTIPNSVISIGDEAFTVCLGLKEVTIPNSVTSIGSGAFSGCSSLTSITIPNSVTSIARYAISQCSSLTDVYCYAENIPTTPNNAFNNSNTNNATLHVPEASIEAYKAAAPWSGFGSIVAIDDEPALRGDVNGDGIVNGTDIQAVINVIVDGEYDENADVNEDGVVNGTDIQEVINIIVNAE